MLPFVKFLKDHSLYIFFIVEVLYLVLIFYSKFEIISPDFKVFYLQSERLLNGQSVFDYNDYVAYNSTFLYLLISPLTIFDLKVASAIFLAINLMLVPIVGWLLVGILGAKEIMTRYVLVVAILEISFYVRSIINNGQVGLIMLLFLLLAVKKFMQQQETTWFTAGMLWFAFELKPYLVIPLLLWIYVVTKNYRLAMKFVLIGCLLQLFYFLLNPSTSLLIYVNLIYSRLGNVSSELDQSSIAAVLYGIFELPKFAAYLIHFTVALIVLARVAPYIREINVGSIALVLSLTSIVNVYLHRQDPIITILILLLLIQKIQDLMYKRFDLVLFCAILVLLTNWGNSSLFLALAMDLLLFIVFTLTKTSFKLSISIFVCSFIMQYFQVQVLSNYGWEASYELWRILILLFSLGCALILPHFKLESLSDKNLKTAISD